MQEIEKIRREKFGNWEWNYGSNPTAEVVRERRYPAGKIQLYINTKKGVIDDLTFFGTFFGINSDLSQVQSRLRGVKYSHDDVHEALSSFDTTPYFAGFSVDELTDAIVG